MQSTDVPRHLPLGPSTPSRPVRPCTQMLASLEDRERRLVGLEEAAAMRRREMEREHAARMAEAEAAVRRLQVRGWGQGWAWVRAD